MVPPCSHRVSRVRRYSGYSWLPSLFAYETITLYGVPSHALLLRYRNAVYCPYPEDIATFGLASSVFARHYLRNLGWCLFLALLRCFSSGGSPRTPILFNARYWSIAPVGFPIRKSPDQRIFAPPRSLSQLVTSFIGSWCQGIHHAPFVAWPIFIWLFFHNQNSVLTIFQVKTIQSFFQSFAFNITKNISWLTSQYVWSYILSFYMQFSKNIIWETWFLKIEQKR